MAEMSSGAEFSECKQYRYKLWRIWDAGKPLAMLIGLNPSTANASKPDATIIILMRVMRTLGYGGFYMTNLFGFISSHPEDLLNSVICVDPMGLNREKLDEVRAQCKDVIFCWGAFKQAKDRAEEVSKQYFGALCFGKNKDGSPFHPRALNYIKGGLDNPQLLPFHSTHWTND